MTEKRILIPDGMLKAVLDAVDGEVKCGGSPKTLAILSTKTALRWQSENPRLPSDKEMQEVFPGWNIANMKRVLAQWICIMYEAPKSDGVDELVTYLESQVPNNRTTWQAGYNTAIADVVAFNRENLAKEK